MASLSRSLRLRGGPRRIDKDATDRRDACAVREHAALVRGAARRADQAVVYCRSLLPKSTSEPTTEPPVEPAAEQRPRRLRLPRACSRTTPGAPAPPHQCLRRPLGCSLHSVVGAARAGSPRASGPRLDACRSGSNAKGRCCPPARAARASFGMTRKASKRRPRTRKGKPSARRRTTSDGAVSSLGDTAKTGGAATTSLEPRARGVSPEPWAGARQGRGRSSAH